MFSLNDLEDCVERSVAVMPQSPPSISSSRQNDCDDGYVTFDAMEKHSERSCHSQSNSQLKRGLEKEQYSSSLFSDVTLDSCPPATLPLYSSSMNSAQTTCRSLPMYYPLDHTHIRLSADCSLLQEQHPLDAILLAQSFLPKRFESKQVVNRAKSKVKGILKMGNETVDFRIRCYKDGNDILMEFHRRQGSALAWNCYFNTIAPLLDIENAQSSTKYVIPFVPSSSMLTHM